MKSVLALSLVLILFACNGTKTINDVSSNEENTDDKQEMSNNINEISLVSGCLSGGECSFEVMQNTKMDFKTDSANMLYPDFVDAKDTNTIKFVYNENADKTETDGHYREEIYFEVKDGIDSINLENAELANVNFLYGRFCYCKGSAGYFKVKEGTLLLEGGRLIISFANGQVPQKLSKITANYN